MDIDITQHLGAVTREVVHGERAGQRTVIVRAGRTYATDQDDLWSGSPTRSGSPGGSPR